MRAEAIAARTRALQIEGCRHATPYYLRAPQTAKTTKKSLAGSLGPSISVRPFRCDAALFLAAETDATRSNSLPRRQLRAGTVISSEAAIANASPFGVDVAGVGRGDARRARGAEGHSSFDRSRPGCRPTAAGPVPMCPGTRRETISSGFARLGGP